MAFRKFRFHPGAGEIEYDNEGAKGITYGREDVDTNKVVSHSIGRLIRSLEWCHRCDLELPEPITSYTIEATVLRAIREGHINLDGMPWTLISGRLRESRCPCCGAFMTEKMVAQQLRLDERDKEF